ncbi:isochorismatase family protein [Oceanivirga salmonicida]|uniref:isochorismatase family protein n=1 Tax=Oceanivirga salmonicida TaxID=1769291 RepID=UPI0012E27BB7|nr:isochorismatase family protein [Oceanivirga salmonicida]
MNKALIILDAQYGIIENNFKNEINNIHKLIKYCEKHNLPVISIKHIDNDPESRIYCNSNKGNIEKYIMEHSSIIIEKNSPNIFRESTLKKYLSENNIEQLIICGFNAEYCCLFTNIIGESLGFKIIYIEDATGSSNNGDTYEMKDLDIVDFVGCVLDWSGIIEVLYLKEFEEKYDK